tara:strand:- start:10142 stop:10846 length:705 start_codon:yes stop_codon:yes gene_type:complete
MDSIKKGFTLLELLVVTSILALVGGAFMINLDSNLLKNAENKLTTYNLSTVKTALVQFRKDMGYFPGFGELAAANLDLDDYDVFGNEVGLSTETWADLSVNFWQLFEQPVKISDPNFWNYKPDYNHGWNGPYITGLNLKLYNAGSNNLNAGDQYDGVYALSDQFFKDFDTQNFSQFNYWGHDGNPNLIISKNGNPLVIKEYLNKYYLISFGEDGVFDSVSNLDKENDIVVYLGK